MKTLFSPTLHTMLLWLSQLPMKGIAEELIRGNLKIRLNKYENKHMRTADNNVCDDDLISDCEIYYKFYGNIGNEGNILRGTTNKTTAPRYSTSMDMDSNYAFDVPIPKSSDKDTVSVVVSVREADNNCRDIEQYDLMGSFRHYFKDLMHMDQWKTDRWSFAHKGNHVSHLYISYKLECSDNSSQVLCKTIERYIEMTVGNKTLTNSTIISPGQKVKCMANGMPNAKIVMKVVKFPRSEWYWATYRSVGVSVAILIIPKNAYKGNYILTCEARTTHYVKIIKTNLDIILQPSQIDAVVTMNLTIIFYIGMCLFAMILLALLGLTIRKFLNQRQKRADASE